MAKNTPSVHTTQTIKMLSSIKKTPCASTSKLNGTNEKCKEEKPSTMILMPWHLNAAQEWDELLSRMLIFSSSCCFSAKEWECDTTSDDDDDEEIRKKKFCFVKSHGIQPIYIRMHAHTDHYLDLHMSRIMLLTFWHIFLVLFNFCGVELPLAWWRLTWDVSRSFSISRSCSRARSLAVRSMSALSCVQWCSL